VLVGMVLARGRGRGGACAGALVSVRAFRCQSFLMHLYYIMDESARERGESELMSTRLRPSFVNSLISAHMACVVSSLSSA
jgi:hypothetical protein